MQRDDITVINVFLDGSNDISKKTIREEDHPIVFRVMREVERRNRKT